MTIRRGQEWGSPSELPRGIAVVGSDAEAAKKLWAGEPVMLAGGDLARTVGAGGTPVDDGYGGQRQLTEAPVDMMAVRVNGRTLPAVAHVVVRPPWNRGGWLRGGLTVVMNAQYLGRLDLAPRGHPNDGRVEVSEVYPSMRFRQRLVAWRRARTGSHLPHPDIATTSSSHIRVTTDGRVVFIDGVCAGRPADDEVVIDVVPDRGVVWF